MKYVYRILLAVVFFITGYHLVERGLVLNNSNDINVEDTESNGQNLTDLEGGRHLQFVYVGSSTCNYSNSPKNHENVKNIKKSIRNYSRENELNFIATGVSMDSDPIEGVDYLENTSPYDEIISGARWYNTGISEYVYENIDSESSTPLVLIIKTLYEIEYGEDGLSIKNVDRSYEIVHASKGSREIGKTSEDISVILKNME